MEMSPAPLVVAKMPSVAPCTVPSAARAVPKTTSLAPARVVLMPSPTVPVIDPPPVTVRAPASIDRMPLPPEIDPVSVLVIVPPARDVHALIGRARQRAGVDEGAAHHVDAVLVAVRGDRPGIVEGGASPRPRRRPPIHPGSARPPAVVSVLSVSSTSVPALT